MNDDLHHLAGAFALDALPEEERTAFEAHYESCAICAQEVREFRETAAVLASAAASAPPSAVRVQMLRSIATVRQQGPVVHELGSRRWSQHRTRSVLSIAAAAAVIAGIIGIWFGGDDADSDSVLAAPDAVVTTLDGATGSLQVVWSAERDELAIIGDGLDDLSDDQVYALWFILEEGVAPAVLFRTVDGEVNEVFTVDDIDGGGFGVTVEPDGGSPQPTSEVIYVGLV